MSLLTKVVPSLMNYYWSHTSPIVCEDAYARWDEVVNEVIDKIMSPPELDIPDSSEHRDRRMRSILALPQHHGGANFTPARTLGVF